MPKTGTPPGSEGGVRRSTYPSWLLLGALRTDTEAVVTELVLPVLAVELPLEVLVVDDDRLFLVAGGDPRADRFGRHLVRLRLEDFVLDLHAVTGESAELARQTVDA